MNNLAGWILISMFLIPFLVTLIVVITNLRVVGRRGYIPDIKVSCYNELLKMIQSGSNLCIGDVAILKDTKQRYILTTIDPKASKHWKEIAPPKCINNQRTYFSAPRVKFRNHNNDIYEHEVIICRTHEFSKRQVSYRQAMAVRRDKFPQVGDLVIDNNIDLWEVLEINEKGYRLKSSGIERITTDYDIFGVVDGTFDYYYKGDF